MKEINTEVCIEDIIKLNNFDEIIEDIIIKESMLASKRDHLYYHDQENYKGFEEENEEKETTEKWLFYDEIFGEDSKNRAYKEEFKGFSNLWDRIIDWSINTGNSHYGITINLMSIRNEPTMDKIEYKKFVENLVNLITDYLKIVTYIMIIPEYNKKGKLHFHGIIFTKNIMDYNKNIRNNLSNYLKENLTDDGELNYHGYVEFGKPPYDIKIDYLKSFLDIKRWNMYLYKEHSKWDKGIYAYYCPDIDFREKWKQDVLCYTNMSELHFNLKVYNIYVDRYEEIIEATGKYTEIEYYRRKDDIYNMLGIKIVNNEINESLIIDLMLNYLLLNKLYIYKNDVYKKLKRFEISYEKIDTIEKILYYNFKENVINFFNINFKAQFESFNIYSLMKENFRNIDKILERVKNITSLKINPEIDTMEFRDGIYLIKYNKFIPKKSLNNIELSTLKYYDKNYDTIKRKEPKVWIDNLLKVLGFKGDFNDMRLFKDINQKGIKIKFIGNKELENMIKICIFIAEMFQDKKDNKKKFLYIHGKTSTGKTTLITKVLTRFLREENIGTSTSDKTFKFQDIIGKILVIMDEFVYEEKLKGDLLKLLGGEKLLISKKYEKEHKTIEILCGIILSNNLMYDDEYRTNEALNARIEIIEFLEKIGIDENREDLLKEEEAQIIIFCNKLYFSLKKVKYNNFNIKKDLKKLNLE